MACKQTWLEDNTGLYRQYTGDLSIVEVLEVNLELHKNPLFNSLHYIIDDYTDTINTPFETNQTAALAKFVRVGANTKGSLKIAIICRNTAESTAIAQRFCEQMKVCHYQCQVFYSLGNAHAWVAGS